MRRPRFTAFGRVAREIARTSAPWASFSQQVDPAFISARLGCLTGAPVYTGLDIAALCLKDE